MAPHFFGHEAVAHEVHGFRTEFFQLVVLVLLQLRVVVAQREPPEGNVLRFVRGLAHCHPSTGPLVDTIFRVQNCSSRSL